MAENTTNSKFYRKIKDLHAYVQELMDHGAGIIDAEKTARIAARPGIEGEPVISWSEDADGYPIVERDAVVSADPVSGVSDWVVTKVDASGCELIDQNGHINQWIVEDSVFRKKYEADPDDPGIYRPAGRLQQFVRLNEAVHILQWGEAGKVDAGGYINITNEEDYYCISGRDFKDTYRIAS
ncbi:MAG: hypothetical protein Q4F28_10780 [Eubacteriales bacterium]|nr:hypothetical protein [Eubacteriales bacterium]